MKTMPKPKPWGFLTLPLELRLIIYKEAYRSHWRLDCELNPEGLYRRRPLAVEHRANSKSEWSYPSERFRSTGVELLRTCKLVYNEATPFFDNGITFSVHVDFKSFTESPALTPVYRPGEIFIKPAMRPGLQLDRLNIHLENLTFERVTNGFTYNPNWKNSLGSAIMPTYVHLRDDFHSFTVKAFIQRERDMIIAFLDHVNFASEAQYISGTRPCVL